MPNLLECPTFKIADRLSILNRTLDALQRGPDFRCDFKGVWRELTPDESANWEARQQICVILDTFPVRALAVPADPSLVVNDIGESLGAEE